MRHPHYKRPKPPKDTFMPFVLICFFAMWAKILYCLFKLAQIGAFDNLF